MTAYELKTAMYNRNMSRMLELVSVRVSVYVLASVHDVAPTAAPVFLVSRQ